jgi:hypothetical protein
MEEQKVLKKIESTRKRAMQIEQIKTQNDERFQMLMEAEERKQQDIMEKQQKISKKNNMDKYVKMQVEHQRFNYLKEEATRIRHQRNLAMQYKVATKFAIEQ